MALFNAPSGIATDTIGNVFVTDSYNNVIRRISTSGTVTTYGGNDTAGYRNGADSVAEFRTPLGVCTDKAGNVYVADTYNNVIRKISTSGKVTTYAGNDTLGYRDGADSIAEFSYPVGLVADSAGNIYVTDNGNNVVRKISNTGMVTTVAGSGQPGYKNGATDTCEFLGLYGIVLDDSNNIYVTEYLNNDVRKISKGMVTTYAGYDSVITPLGLRNGKSDSAFFNNPTGLAIDSAGSIYVADEFNNVIRKIHNDSVTTFAGTSAPGLVNGIDTIAEFNQPLGLALDKKGNFYVADNQNYVVRKIALPAPLGIASLQNKTSELIVYPNPCNDKLVVASSIAGKAELYDMMGKQIWSNEHFKAPYTLSTTDLVPGIYFLRVSNSSVSATKKIVIER